MHKIDKKTLFANELKSGLVVALVALPLCLGISLASGAPPIAGIIAGIIGGLVIGFLSHSQVSVSGPAAGLAVIVFTAINELGSYPAFLAVVALAGVIQIGLGYLRAGVIAHFLPISVIEGMLASIGLLLIIKQIPFALGINHFHGYLSVFTNSGVGELNIYELSIGAICLAFYVIYLKTKLKNLKLFKIVPFSLCLVVIAAILASLFGERIGTDYFVHLGSLDHGGSLLNAITLPNFSNLLSWLSFKHALMIAIVASVETLLCIEASDKLDPFKRVTSTHRELMAQGAGNIFSGMLGGLPTTSVIVRTSVNIQSGARTKWSSVIHGAILLLGVGCFPFLITKIPIAVLAVILIVTGYNLVNPKLIKKVIKEGPEQFIPFFVTIIGVVSIDLLMGVLLGIGVAGFIILRNNYLAQAFEIKHTLLKKGEKHSLALSSYVTFLSKASIKKTLNSFVGPCEVEIDLSRTRIMDHDVIEVLRDFIQASKIKEIKLNFIFNGNTHMETEVVKWQS